MFHLWECKSCSTYINLATSRIIHKYCGRKQKSRKDGKEIREKKVVAVVMNFTRSMDHYIPIILLVIEWTLLIADDWWGLIEAENEVEFLILSTRHSPIENFRIVEWKLKSIDFSIVFFQMDPSSTNRFSRIQFSSHKAQRRFQRTRVERKLWIIGPISLTMKETKSFPGYFQVFSVNSVIQALRFHRFFF